VIVRKIRGLREQVLRQRASGQRAQSIDDFDEDGGRVPKWIELRRQTFGEEFLDSSDWCEQKLQMFPGISELTLRERSALKGIRVGVLEQTPRVVGVSQTIGRAALCGDGMVGHIARRCRRYLTHRGRLMVGIEAMRAQGVSFGEYQAVMEATPSPLLVDLAGNAFQTGQCLATMVAVVATLATSWSLSKLKSEAAASLTAAPSCEPSSSTDDSVADDDFG